MWRCREAELNWVKTYIRLKPAFILLLIGISTSLYFPPKGHAGFALSAVKGYRRVPFPPPSITVSTFTLVTSVYIYSRIIFEVKPE
jgi:hypothetical protein